MYNVPHFMYPFLVEGHLDCFQLLAIITKATMIIMEYVSLLHVEASSGYIPRSVIAGYSCNTMSNFLMYCQTHFQSDFFRLQSHQQWRSVPLSLHPYKHLLSPEFLILVILTGVR